MKSVAQVIERTIRESVDSAGYVEELDAASMLSPFLAGLFSVYRARMLGEEVFFAELRGGVDDYGVLRKQLDQLASGLGLPKGQRVVFFTDALPPNVRRSFLETRNPFATARGDFYVPFLAFRIEASGQRGFPMVRRFRSSDQSVFLFGLYAEGSFTQEEVIRTTGLSVGSVSRALANLVAARALDYEVGGRTGRKKSYFRANDKLYYQVGREFFGEIGDAPVYTDALPEGVHVFASGLSALALSSDLLASSREALAVGPQYRHLIVPTAPDPTRGPRYAIQALHYDPEPFSVDGRVDPFTMLMTIPNADRSDERVRIALREALEGYGWYTD